MDNLLCILSTRNVFFGFYDNSRNFALTAFVHFALFVFHDNIFRTFQIDYSLPMVLILKRKVIPSVLGSTKEYDGRFIIWESMHSKPKSFCMCLE